VRADMAKVIVERPRKTGCAWNKPKGYGRRLCSYGDCGPPRFEGMRTRWGNGRKYFNEHLGPLRRYLDDQVGRPWDDVFSEICTHINRNSAVQDHVRDHVERYVLRHVILVDGVPCSGDPRWGHGRPLQEMRRWIPWYVCPRTGLLLRTPVRPSGQRHGASRKQPRSIRVNEELQCHFRNGFWHLVTLRPMPTDQRERCQEVDALLGRTVADIGAEEARGLYGARVYAISAHRLTRRGQRQYPIPSQLWT
jgi:hypothetical protein